MLNYLWAFMILTGILYASFAGNLPAVTEAALDSAQEAVSLCITMAGVLALWVGLMRIAEHAGIMLKATDKIYPLLHFLFPRI
ncbi:MAG: nucleoside recognition protein, partial [Lachnospiraceae bacterium]|nr:nucleoside recognition protein [Lachnospiraceae bacterium]